MSNTTDPAGAQNVVIENVTPDSMKINVNGEVKEIRNGLDELKTLLQNLNLENFKSGDKIYNIGTITNAVFSAEVGKKTYNMQLCRKLTEALYNYSPDAKSFLDEKKDLAGWELQGRFFRKANNFIISGFVGVLGILLRKVFSSGIDAFESNKPKDYLEVCIATAKRTLQLLCFSFISKLWDHKKDNKCTLSSVQANELDNFFNTDIELNIAEYVKLLKTVVSIFDEQKIEYPFSEFKKDCLDDTSDFIKACNNLNTINSKLDTGQFTLSTSFEAENELAVFLSTMNFLAAYKMVCVKNISYEEVRHKDAQYLHAYTFLGADNDKLYSSKYKYDTKPITSDAVLIFKNKYQDGLNLFPFIIDYNSLTDESEVRICFYTSYEENKKKLTYSDINKISSDKTDSAKDLGEASLISVSYNNDVESELKLNIDNDITRLKNDAKKYHDLKLNMLYKIFQNAMEETLK